MNYWEWGIAPCQISDELYYVGTKKGPSHLLVTDDGLVLIDTCHPQSLYMLLQNIRTLGFNYEDVAHIIHTHGHIDHMGGTRALIEISKAKTYIGKGDEDAVSGKNDLTCCNELSRPFEEPFTPDVIIQDGETYKFGETEILFLSTPGHTDGTLSLFLNLHWKGKTYRAGMFGGAGYNTLTKEYLDRYNLPISNRDKYLNSLDRLKKEKVEIHLGNHLKDNRHIEKVALLRSMDNPFIDETSWQTFLEQKRLGAIEFFKKH